MMPRTLAPWFGPTARLCTLAVRFAGVSEIVIVRCDDVPDFDCLEQRGDEIVVAGRAGLNWLDMVMNRPFLYSASMSASSVGLISLFSTCIIYATRVCYRATRVGAYRYLISLSTPSCSSKLPFLG